MKNDIDGKLVRACQARRGRIDPVAFRALYERHKDRVYNTCYRLTGNADDALDASQEVFVNVLRYLDGYAFRSCFSTWIYRIAVNACHDIGRRRRSRPVAFLDALADGPTDAPLYQPTANVAPPDVEAGAADLEDVVQAALMQLPWKLRQLLVLRYFEGLSYLEIAHVLSIPEGTVKSRQNRAHAALCKHLDPALIDA